jgi:pimeloyl-ACP methyl ester carboxylesterase
MISTTLPRSELAGLSAIVAGTGRPVLLLHGVGLRAEAWGAQIKALRDTYHVIAPDMPGHGQTPCNAQCKVLGDYVKAVLPLLRMLDEPALVVGHSMGAMIALELASSAPDCVRAVAALNAIFERSDGAKAAVQARAASLDGHTVPDPTPTLERWFGTGQSSQRSACDDWLRMADPLGYKQAYTAFAHADGPSRQALNRLACPALFATGALEPNSTPDMSRMMADLAPQGRALVVDGAAHMMPMTHPADVNSALSAFAQDIWP